MLQKSSRRLNPGKSRLKVAGSIPRQVQVSSDEVVNVKHHSVPNGGANGPTGPELSGLGLDLIVPRLGRIMLLPYVLRVC